MTKSAKRSELIAVRVEHERRWAYERWLERLTWSQMRMAARLPESEGGLGYDLSEQAMRGLVNQARASAGELSMGRAERVERQLVEVDARARAARRDLDAVYRAARAIDAAVSALDPRDRDEASLLSPLVAQRASLARELELAEKRLDSAQDREAKLVGLYAATEAKLEVTTRDGVIEDLNAALSRLGEAPVKTTEKADR